MKIKQLLLLIIMVLMITPLVAQTVPEGGMNMEQLILYLTPFLVYAAGELYKLVAPNIKGVLLLVLVSASSGIIAFVTSLAANPEYGWTGQFVLGLMAVVVNQFFKQVKSGD